MSELVEQSWRILAVVEMLVLLLCAVYLHGAYRGPLRGTPLWHLGFAYGVVLVAVTAAVMVNMLSPIPPTPGVKLLTLLLAPVVMWVSKVTVDVMRHKR